jgi:hypothetical protein
MSAAPCARDPTACDGGHGTLVRNGEHYRCPHGSEHLVLTQDFSAAGETSGHCN